MRFLFSDPDPTMYVPPSRHDYRYLVRHNGRVRLHLYTGSLGWEGYRRYDVAHNLTRWQAFKLGCRLVWKALT